ncbi:MAG: DNRLRE domain-containing protein [Planctomycetota bacterium]|nr:DNRLRE domain-containing protein [Planctomycetota bacterium]
MVVAAGAAGVAQGQDVRPPFMLVAIPDTQYYSENPAWTYQFYDQTAWIVQNRQRYNTAFVSHLGDIVDNGASIDAEWIRADAAIDTLDGQVPYSVPPGNHDYNTVSNKSSGLTTYLSRFGPQRYTGYPWYLGSSANGGNHAQRFEASGRTYLHLGLEWRPDAAALAWAQGVINDNRGLPTIISTHEHLRDADSSGNNAGRSTAGQFTWDNLIRSNRQIFMVLNGHFHSGSTAASGEHYQVANNNFIVAVTEMLSDFQGRASGGGGWFRTIRFDEQSGLVRVRTLSPTLDSYERDANSEMTFAIDFPNRFGDQPAPPAKFRTLTFQEGLSGYAGTQDTTLASAAPDANRSGLDSLFVDALDGSPGGPVHTLIRFDWLFGSGLNQIAPDSDVVLAKLRVPISNPGSGINVHRMLQAWTEAATWNAFAGGVSPDGIEALASPEVVAGANSSAVNVPLITLELEVTSAVRAWLNGAPNHGLALLPFIQGSDGVGFPSSEFASLAQRPQLVVTTPTAPVRVRSFQQGVDAYSGTRDTGLRQATGNTAQPEAPTIVVDADEPATSSFDAQMLVRFENLWGAGGIPPGATITSALLTLNVRDQGSGFTLHRVLVPWEETSTWASTLNGVAADDAEAMIYPEEIAGQNSTSASVRAGAVLLDVTESIQEWNATSNPNAANLGWVLRPFLNGGDGVEVDSSESPTVAARPRLVVRYTGGACPADFNSDGQPDFFDYLDFAAAFSNEDPSADFNTDGNVDFFDYLDFAQAFNDGC